MYFFLGGGGVFFSVYLDVFFPESSRTIFCVSDTKVRGLVVRHIEEDALDLLSEKIGLPSRLVVKLLEPIIAETSQLNLFSLQLVDPRNTFFFCEVLGIAISTGTLERS